jgi:hypothetical protein
VATLAVKRTLSARWLSRSITLAWSGPSNREKIMTYLISSHIIFPVLCPYCRGVILNWDTAPPMDEHRHRLQQFPCKHCGKAIDMADYVEGHAAIIPGISKRGPLRIDLSIPARNSARTVSNGVDPGKPIRKGGKTLVVLSVIETLTENGKWGWTKPQIAQSAGCTSRTVQSLVKNDPEIKAAWKKYEFDGDRRPNPKSRRRKLQMRSNDAK